MHKIATTAAASSGHPNLQPRSNSRAPSLGAGFSLLSFAIVGCPFFLLPNDGVQPWSRRPCKVQAATEAVLWYVHRGTGRQLQANYALSRLLVNTLPLQHCTKLPSAYNSALLVHNHVRQGVPDNTGCVALGKVQGAARGLLPPTRTARF